MGPLSLLEGRPPAAEEASGQEGQGLRPLPTPRRCEGRRGDRDAPHSHRLLSGPASSTYGKAFPAPGWGPQAPGGRLDVFLGQV